MKETKRRGPKPQLVSPSSRTLTLTQEVIGKAKEIGNGNISAGVRKAVTEYKQQPNVNLKEKGQ